MPELPEVETVRQALKPLEGAIIRSAWQSELPLRWSLSQADAQGLFGLRLLQIGRRGRHLLIPLSDGGSLLIHLGMSGWIRRQGSDEPARKHDHFSLRLDDGSSLVLNDPRRFGGVMRSARPDGSDLPIISGLGWEPLDPALSPEALKALYNRSSKPIKTLLMDNALVTGIGNIYASEILFKSGIHPDKAGSKITLPNAKALLSNARLVLQEAIASGGSTLRDFKHVDGESGQAQRAHQVYARAGSPCSQCGAALKKSAHSGRSTFFCSNCQKRR